ncbi:MAG: dTMP kinase [Hyphomicrobiaceae bacterium]|nr:dTMP kinase [Hyphomicrobiaceae bacterium]
MAAAGRFITFEGGEGSGKSTQARRLAERLRGAGLDVLLTREPGGSPFAEQIRGILLGGTLAPHPPIAEALLFYAARADHLEATIRPALAAGRWVICDRFSDSTRAYQGAAGGVPDAALAMLEGLVVAQSAPDATFILDIDARTGLARATRRREAVEGTEIDPFEGRALAFHERLRQGYLAIAAADPRRCVSLDASAPVDAIADRIWELVRQRFAVAVH